MSNATHYAIYTIHMPMFILITGILSRRKTTIKKAIANYIIPYIVFDSLYLAFESILGIKVNWNIFIPTFLYWYILCIAIMKILYFRVDSTALLFFSIALSVAVAFCVPEHIWRLFSFGRVVLLFPVFLVGVNMSIDKLNGLYNRKFIPILIGIVSSAVIIFLAVSGTVPLNWATHDYYGDLPALALKYVFMASTIGIFIFLFVFIPKWSMLQHWGKNSLIIYLVHPFPVLIVRYIVSKLTLSGLAELIVMVLSALSITVILSLDCIREVYDRIFGKVKKILKLEA